MAGMTHHNQGRMAAGGAAPAARWYANADVARIRVRDLFEIAPTSETAAVKPSHGFTRRPLEGSS